MIDNWRLADVNPVIFERSPSVYVLNKNHGNYRHELGITKNNANDLLLKNLFPIEIKAKQFTLFKVDELHALSSIMLLYGAVVLSALHHATRQHRVG